VTLRRLRTEAATNTRLTTPGCAAPSGFLNLLTRYSAPALPALFHAGNAPGLSPTEGFPSDSRHASRRALSLLPFPVRTSKSIRRHHPTTRTSQLQGLMHSEGPVPRPGVTRGPAARASRGLFPFEDFPLRVSVPCLHETSFPGLRRDTEPKFIITSALQSIKEPEDQLASFENCCPP
jgi:hypothetical protein